MPDVIRHPGKKQIWIPAFAGMTKGKINHHENLGCQSGIFKPAKPSR
jgi:hypothetical protein